jgi:hypothetical protein
MLRLSELLENAFRDDLRNGISHADYVIWQDGVRLSNRNGGYPSKLSFADINDALTRGSIFFQVLNENNNISIARYNPPKTIVGRFSANLPMSWTLSYDPATRVFGISGSSPGSVTTPEYLRQVAINGLLGGKVLALFAPNGSQSGSEIEKHIIDAGFEPNIVLLTSEAIAALVDDISRRSLWDERHPNGTCGEVLLASPWGFRRMSTPSEFGEILPRPVLDFQIKTKADQLSLMGAFLERIRKLESSISWIVKIGHRR